MKSNKNSNQVGNLKNYAAEADNARFVPFSQHILVTRANQTTLHTEDLISTGCKRPVPEHTTAGCKRPVPEDTTVIGPDETTVFGPDWWYGPSLPEEDATVIVTDKPTFFAPDETTVFGPDWWYGPSLPEDATVIVTDKPTFFAPDETTWIGPEEETKDEREAEA